MLLCFIFIPNPLNVKSIAGLVRILFKIANYHWRIIKLKLILVKIHGNIFFQNTNCVKDETEDKNN